jgi:hypothetical protein
LPLALFTVNNIRSATQFATALAVHGAASAGQYAVIRLRNVLFGKKKNGRDAHNQQRKHSNFFHNFLL